jgi:hypothetical protein
MFKQILLWSVLLISFNAKAISVTGNDSLSHKFNLAFSINQGSTGFGAELLSKPLKQFGFRIGHYTGTFVGTYYTIFDNKEILVDGKIKFSMSNLFLDYFPFKSNTFRISTGISFNQNKYQTTLSPGEAQKIGYIFYSPEKLGNVILIAKGNQFSPYLGIGFGNNKPKYRVGLGVDLGLFYQGKPNFTVIGNGSFKPSGTSENEQLLENAFRNFVVYPFANFSLRFRIKK